VTAPDRAGAVNLAKQFTSDMKLRRAILPGSLAAVLIIALSSAILFHSSWRFQRIASAFVTGEARDMRRLEVDVERVQIPGSLRLVADYYPGSDKRELALLVHGSDPKGRRSALNRLLAAYLQQSGLSVLALDLSGFNESDDPELPFASPPLFVQNVTAAATYAIESGIARRGGIVYVGHSLGAGVVLMAAGCEPRPAAVIALGAPATEGLKHGDRLDDFALQRFRDMGIVPDGVALAVMKKYLLQLDVVRQLEQGELSDVLLVYGERERPAERVFEAIRKTSQRSRIHIAERADHYYCVTDAVLGWIVYNRTVIEDLTRVIVSWAAARSSPTDELSRQWRQH